MSKRQTLASFAPQRVQPDGGKVVQAAAEPPTAATGKRPPSVTVYLTAEEIRTLKLIGIEHDKKMTDICAEAVREWLERNGHARGKIFAKA
jgi:hypothetical protein